jgi:hypothetical protein
MDRGSLAPPFLSSSSSSYLHLLPREKRTAMHRRIPIYTCALTRVYDRILEHCSLSIVVAAQEHGT